MLEAASFLSTALFTEMCQNKKPSVVLSVTSRVSLQSGIPVGPQIFWACCKLVLSVPPELYFLIGSRTGTGPCPERLTIADSEPILMERSWSWPVVLSPSHLYQNDTFPSAPLFPPFTKVIVRVLPSSDTFPVAISSPLAFFIELKAEEANLTSSGIEIVNVSPTSTPPSISQWYEIFSPSVVTWEIFTWLVNSFACVLYAPIEIRSARAANAEKTAKNSFFIDTPFYSFYSWYTKQDNFSTNILSGQIIRLNNFYKISIELCEMKIL